MKSIKPLFKKLKKENPLLGDVINFMGAVKGRNFSSHLIRRWFPKLVDPADYFKDEKNLILREAIRLTASPK